MRRKDWAWLMALVLVMELVLFACTCVQVNHHCPAGEPCAICTYLRTMFRGAIVLHLAIGLLTVAAMRRAAGDERWNPRCDGSLISKKVRMND